MRTTRERVELKRKRIMRFNEEMPGYNPLFLNQGDSKIKQSHGEFLKVKVSIDADTLSNSDANRAVRKQVEKVGSFKNPMIEQIPEISPMANQSVSIVDRVHKTLVSAPSAYSKQIESGVENIKNVKGTSERVFRALRKKGVSVTVARETIKMIERGVPVDRLRKEVSDLIAEAVKINSKPKNGRRVSTISQMDMVPQIVMKERNQIPSVTLDELHEVSVDVKSDPILRKIAEEKMQPVEVVASSSSRNQVDEVLKTIASSSIIDGSTAEPTDAEITKTSMMALQPSPVSVSTMSQVARGMGVPGPSPEDSPKELFQRSQQLVPEFKSFMVPTETKSGPVQVPSSFTVKKPEVLPPAKTVESPFLKTGTAITEVVSSDGNIRLAPVTPSGAIGPALRPQDKIENATIKTENSGDSGGSNKLLIAGLGAIGIWYVFLRRK